MKKYPSEIYKYRDLDTGAAVTRLTGFRCNSNHLYFTNNCFYKDGTRLVFESDRDNALNFYSLDLESGEIEQLSELPRRPYPEEPALHEAFVDPVYERCVFFAYGKLYALDLSTKEMRVLWELPRGFFHHITSVTCDGKYVLTSIYEQAESKMTSDRDLKKIEKSKPLSKILKIDIESGECECLFEERCFIAHVNASPTDPDLLTFCHEGRWDEVDHRLWIMSISEGVPRKLHVCKEGESIGHEYWYADGKRVGYHGHKNGEAHLGCASVDGKEDVSYAFPFNTGHIFSSDEDLIVGDGFAAGKYIRLWQLTEDGYDEPRALCAHNCSFKRQRAHVHPRLTPDGKKVLYTSDETGYEQLYIAEIPEDIESLPKLSELWNK